MTTATPAPVPRTVGPGLRRLVVGATTVGVMLVAGCGNDTSTSSSDGTAAAEAQSGGAPLAAERAASIPLTVVDDGSEVALADVAATDRPTLLWFWAPF